MSASYKWDEISSALSQHLDSHLEERYRYPTSLCGRNIRLIRLEPGSGAETICCSFVEKCVDEDVSYNCVSYVWGDSSDCRSIECEGKCFMITRNLYEFLWHLREDGERTLLWADAICINQSNNEEKDSQVRMMYDIYSRAKIVIAWLGVETEHTRVGFKLVHRLHQILNGNPRFDDNDQSIGRTFDQATLAGIAFIWTRPLFSRIWIVQEMMAARHLILRSGRQSVEAEELFEVTDALYHSPQLHSMLLVSIRGKERPIQYNILKIARLRQSLKRERDPFVARRLVDLVISTVTFQATIPLDKIFALSWLASDGQPELITYNQDIREVLITLIKGSIQGQLHPGSVLPVDLLSYVVHSSRDPQASDLPSWVPPFHDYPRGYEPLVDVLFPGSLLEMHDLWYVQRYFIFGSDNTFSILGTLCDTIKTTTDVDTRSDVRLDDMFNPAGFHYPILLLDLIKDCVDSGSRFSYLRGWKKENMLPWLMMRASWFENGMSLVATLYSYPTGELPFDAYWRTLICDTIPASKDDPNACLVGLPFRYGHPNAYVVRPPLGYREKWLAMVESSRIAPNVIQRSLPPSAFLTGHFLFFSSQLIFSLLAIWINPTKRASWSGAVILLLFAFMICFTLLVFLRRIIVSFYLFYREYVFYPALARSSRF